MGLVVFICIAFIVVCAIFLSVSNSNSIKEEERRKKEYEDLMNSIDHTDLMAATDTQCYFRIHDKDGKTRVVVAGKQTVLYEACFQKLV